ncbi:MAG TPA: hypothetical protein VFU02_08285 [Polyangiaceae bacterium]|nr:hypothetical protein [Polyangiaceae bacterium]
MKTRLLRFLAGPELGLVSPLLFAGLYTWPLLTFSSPGATFRFMFVAWCVHIALIATMNLAERTLEKLDPADLEATDRPSP